MAFSATASSPSDLASRCVIALGGVVQGLGVRPTIYRLAVGHGLAGIVRNTRQGVLVDAEGTRPAIRSFIAALTAALPRAHLTPRWETPAGRHEDFSIESSDCDGATALPLAADLATCEACASD